VSRIRWLAPSPLWDDLVGTPADFRAPALLRFAGDDFIEQFQAVLDKDPRTLRRFVARPETWREPAAGLDTPPSTQHPLRLYQPVHGRFYLATATLACRVPGLPEHTVDVADGEVVAFVLRRLTVDVHPQTGAETETGEWAWVKREDGSEGWVSAAGEAMAADEELHPMFGSTFQGTGGPKRRVFAGLVPASRREAFVAGRELAAPSPPEAGTTPEITAEEPRMVDFQRAVIDPWVALAEWWDSVEGEPNAELERQTLESSSSLIILDFAEFLERWLDPVLQAVRTDDADSLSPHQTVLYERLAGQRMWTREKTIETSRTFAEALRDAYELRTKFDELTLVEGSEQDTVPDGFSPVVFLDPGTDNPTPPPDPLPDFTALAALIERDQDGGDVLDRPLARLMRDALAEAPAPAATPQLPPMPPANAQGDDWFVIRCAYLRPRCGRNSPPLISGRSEQFRLTSFFEPDAPARPLRVAMPVDTSPATLRKYDRNVAFMLSDQLRKQMSRASSLKDLMDGKAGGVKPGLDIGVICSFSIPIITICALILLMIIVSLLNIVFWWLPLFKVCFPVPGLKAKG
jgi:hypothetical protein